MRHMKKLFFYGLFMVTGITLISFFMFAGKYKDYVHVIPNIKNREILIRSLENYRILGEDERELSKNEKNSILGHMFIDIAPGVYEIIKDTKGIEKIFSVEKENEGKEVYRNLNIKPLKPMDKFVLNGLLCLLILFNSLIFINLRRDLRKNFLLKFTYGILIIKMIFSFQGSFQEFGLGKFYSLGNIEIFLSKGLGFLMGYYLVENMIYDKFYRGVFYIWILLAYFYTLVLLFGLMDISYYGYLLKHYRRTMDTILDTGWILDFSKIILVMGAYIFYTLKDRISSKRYLSWGIIYVSLWLMECSVYICPRVIEGHYFIELLEVMSIYWLIIILTIRIYYEKIKLVMRFIVGFVIVYCALLFFKSVDMALVTILTVVVLEFYTELIENIVREDRDKIENICNNLSLVESIGAFENQLEYQLNKYVKVNRIKIIIFKEQEKRFRYIKSREKKLYYVKQEMVGGKYTIGFRIFFNQNPYVGIILIDEKEELLTLDEFNFLLELTKVVGEMGNKIRLYSLYRELK